MTDHRIKRHSIQSFARNAGRIMLYIISILSACMLILVGVLLFGSYPGKPRPFVDENGSPPAARVPELYFAYIGMAQMTYQVKSENLAYEYMLPKFKENGNIRMPRILEENLVTRQSPCRRSLVSIHSKDKTTYPLGHTVHSDSKDSPSGGGVLV